MCLGMTPGFPRSWHSSEESQKVSPPPSCPTLSCPLRRSLSPALVLRAPKDLAKKEREFSESWAHRAETDERSGLWFRQICKREEPSLVPVFMLRPNKRTNGWGRGLSVPQCRGLLGSPLSCTHECHGIKGPCLKT